MSLQEIIDSLGRLSAQIITATLSALFDASLWVLEAVLNTIAALLVALPAPSVTTHTFGELLVPLPPFAKYAISHMDFAGAFALITAGFAFYIARKLITLFQW
jgi:hypothetical protein